ncbi:MAG: hypothetical protein J6X92_05190 [Bacteroidales bacterium]|nr:hypothetical protein [Bacteroidales bacterium]
MIKYCYKYWNQNKEELRGAIKEDKTLNSCGYKYLVELVTKYILGDEWDADGITEIDNGDYQGTLLYLIPRKKYQPLSHDYLMTCMGYGSCSGCDTLQGIQEYIWDALPTEQQVSEFMLLCEDLVTNMIKPYNQGWRYDSDFDTIDY